MVQTIEVRFKGNRRGFYDWHDLTAPLHLNEPVLVEAERGFDFGYVNTTGATAEAKCGGCDSCGVTDPAGEIVYTLESLPEPTTAAPESPASVEPAEAAPQPTVAAPKPKVARRASPEEIKQHQEVRREEDEVRRKVIERVKAHELVMRISDAEWQWDRNRLTLYFTSERRVDFRKLVRELASTFRTRIELRQIGVRDESARLGGVGRCGREYCCSTWLTEPGPVNLALAKDQHLSLNPSQISGGCGRLLCCLRYEHDFYLASRKRYPKEGKMIRTMLGAEKVVAVDIFRERVSLRSEEHGMRTIPVIDLREEMERAPAGEIAAVVAAPAPPANRPAARPANRPNPRPTNQHANAPEQKSETPPQDAKNHRGNRRPPRGGPPPKGQA